MKQKLRGFVILFFALSSQLFFAQERTVSGVVSDNAGIPLPGVSILVKGTKLGVQTDFDGKYEIDINGGQTLTYSYIGMEEVTQPIYAQQMNVKLGDNTTMLDSVVVEAYRATSKHRNSSQDDSEQEPEPDRTATAMLNNKVLLIQVLKLLSLIAYYQPQMLR